MASTLDELLQRLDYLPALTRDAETALITKAYNFAERAHSGQLRKSGEPYFTHPVGVAGIIADVSFFVIFMFLFFLGFIAEMKLDAASLSFFVLFIFFLVFLGIIAEMKLDTASVITGLLHDTVEDTLATLEVIEAEFGAEIAQLVDGVTKIGKIQFRSKEEQQVCV